MNTQTIELIKIIILLFFSAFFSATESAFFSIDFITREKIRSMKEKKLNLISNILRNPNRLLITILVGNMFVNIFASSLGSAFSINLFKRFNLSDLIGTSVAFVFMSLIIIIFGEIVPKIIAVSSPLKFAKKNVYLINFFIYILRPFTIFFEFITNIITDKLIKYKPDTVREKDLQAIINAAYKERIIDQDERELFENIFDCVTTKISEIMIPLSEFFMVNIDEESDKIIKKIIKSKYLKVLVYKEKRENVAGIIMKKDLLPYILKKQKIDITRLITPVVFVKESETINGILKKFQNIKKDIAVVVNSYRKPVGVITIEAIIKSIMGEYRLEF